MLLAQVISRVELEDQHVIAASRSPTVNVDANQKHEQDDQQRSAVQTKSNLENLPVRVIDMRRFRVEYCRKYHSHEQNEEASGEQADFEGRPWTLCFTWMNEKLSADQDNR